MHNSSEDVIGSGNVTPFGGCTTKYSTCIAVGAGRGDASLPVGEGEIRDLLYPILDT